MFKTDEQPKIVAEPAKIDVARLTIVGKAKDLLRQAKLPAGRGMLEVADVLLAVALPTPFVIKGDYDMGFAARGGMHKRLYKIERNGFAGPIEVSLADRQARHLQGVEGPAITVPAGAIGIHLLRLSPPVDGNGTDLPGVRHGRGGDQGTRRLGESRVVQFRRHKRAVGGCGGAWQTCQAPPQPPTAATELERHAIPTIWFLDHPHAHDAHPASPSRFLAGLRRSK